MRILFLSLLFFIIYSLPVVAQEPLKAIITKEWTVDSAREESFKNIEYTKDLSEYPTIDPNLIENKLAIEQNLSKVANRLINHYNDNTYAIKILENGLFDKVFYYNSQGKLYRVGYDCYTKEITSEKQYYKSVNDVNFYPLKTYRYNFPTGELIAVGIYVKSDASFEFNAKGELIARWIGNQCYDANGNIMYNRW